MSDDVLRFWFTELTPEQWWSKDEQLDRLIKEKFLTLHERAARCELFAWRETARGRLAEIIVLDQFPRNMFRDSARAFATDALALVLAQEAVACKADAELKPDEKAFLYMPFMHSESLIIHEQAIALFRQPGLEKNLDFELKHKVIIEKFGRYPHRNEVLGRKSSPAELEFLQQPGSSF